MRTFLVVILLLAASSANAQQVAPAWAIGEKWNFSSRGDSRRSKRFTSPRKMARRCSAAPTELGPWRQASRRIWCYSMATSRKTSR